ncbi:hypothetical protein MWN33_05725 [Starkeya koreensis]|uniref:DUF4435 domain-containing protein n=1 Tax=Ancylobacter koreensis TaxID=266121 RepID=A0ABT0DJT1_9HYPH|nr:DUF4435 domain-containing protein [Ancylobacter koreensis]MCK0207530.1 hypothetical protein [Ancylobacter koreensis]
MLSIGSELDEYDIAQQVRLERQAHKGSFLLLEGAGDIDKLEPFIQQKNCSIINCYGRGNAVGAIELLYDEGFEGAVAIVDADFDRLVGEVEVHEGLVYTAGHDLDMDFVNSTAFDIFILEQSSVEKLNNLGGVGAIREKLHLAIKPLSVTRYINVVGIINFKLSDVFIECCCIEGHAKPERIVAAIFNGKAPDTSRDEMLINLIERHSRQSFDYNQLTNGHDFIRLLGMFMQSQIAEWLPYFCTEKNIMAEICRRMSDDYFCKLAIFRNIREWELESGKYNIFRADLN